MAALVVWDLPGHARNRLSAPSYTKFPNKRPPEGGLSAYLIGLVIRLREGKRSDCDGDTP
jgi:hypothetical protein